VSHPPPSALAQRLYALQQRKQAGDPTADWFYVPASQLQYQLQGSDAIALAHFYSALDTTCHFGPSVRNLVQASLQPPATDPWQDTTEAWGHAVLETLAKNTAKQVVGMLLPVFKANGMVIPPQVEAGLNASFEHRPKPTEPLTLVA
jgi:hypothetical protein